MHVFEDYKKSTIFIRYLKHDLNIVIRYCVETQTIGSLSDDVCYFKLKFLSRNLRVHQAGKFLSAVDNKQQFVFQGPSNLGSSVDFCLLSFV